MSGVQFDRFGALWLGGVELLRTTTPEPDTGVAPGVHWHVEKDVTDYGAVFSARPGSVNVTVAIPNVVNPTYTGIEYVRATLTFYSSVVTCAAAATASTAPPASGVVTVIPLADPTADPWTITAITMPNISLKHTVRVPVAAAGRVSQAFVDVYVTNHGGSEEFWYTTGASYRELNLYIDGCLAGAFYPFPVIYSGGVNPLLWRPMTSVLTLNVPAYRLDVTPFAGLLNDGKPHSYEFYVRDADPVGVWYVDPVLVLRLQPAGLPKLSGGLASCHSYMPRDPARTVTVVNTTTPAGRRTTGHFEFSVQGHLSDGTDTTVSAKLDSTNFNSAGNLLASRERWSSSSLAAVGVAVDDANDVGDLTTGSMGLKTTVTTEGRGGRHTVRRAVHTYPYRVLDTSRDDSKGTHTFLLNATVNITRQRSEIFEGAGLVAPTELAWELGINASGQYNRSETNHSLINLEANDSNERYTLSVQGGLAGGQDDNDGGAVSADDVTAGHACFSRTLHAQSGHVRSEVALESQCRGIPKGLRVCGSDLCGFFAAP